MRAQPPIPLGVLAQRLAVSAQALHRPEGCAFTQRLDLSEQGQNTFASRDHELCKVRSAAINIGRSVVLIVVAINQERFSIYGVGAIRLATYYASVRMLAERDGVAAPIQIGWECLSQGLQLFFVDAHV
ncbi:MULTISPECIES: hypothetical protein, partial [unclassified Pseudomonas]|uniref:hypothetical protein n=1 Tax=unclassified Pseudomonas TaxID=196821 RepID=UPI0019D3745C